MSEQIEPDLADVWRDHHDDVRSRSERLLSAVTLLQSDRLDPATLESAIRDAHQLAGVLGTFGLRRGSGLAAAIESALATRGELSASKIESLAKELFDLVRSAEPS